MNSRINDYYSAGEIDPSTNPVALIEQAHGFSRSESVQVCMVGSEGSGKNVAQMYLLHQSHPETSGDSTMENYFDVRVMNALGQFEMTLQSVPSAFPALEDAVFRECDVFMLMYDRNNRQSYEYAVTRARKIMRMQEDEDVPKQFVFIANSKGEDMSFVNLSNWISSNNEAIISRNSGVQLARDFGGVYIETESGAGNEISEALSACLNLHINGAVQARPEEPRNALANPFRGLWYDGVRLTRPMRYAFRDGILTTQVAISSRFNVFTEQ